MSILYNLLIAYMICRSASLCQDQITSEMHSSLHVSIGYILARYVHTPLPMQSADSHLDHLLSRVSDMIPNPAIVGDHV